jgi:fructuronate reductase
MAGSFPAGRPGWEVPGAQVVADVVPFEQRKLRLLNGAHSLMAYAASALGHATVADAIADATVREWVEQWWNAAAHHLALPLEDLTSYRAALLERFANPGIRHLLAQIAADGSQKIPIRAVPVVKAHLADGLAEPGALRLVSSWIVHLRGHGAPVTDTRATDLVALAGGPVEDTVVRVLQWLDLEPDPLRELAEQQVRKLEGLARTTS